MLLAYSILSRFKNQYYVGSRCKSEPFSTESNRIFNRKLRVSLINPTGTSCGLILSDTESSGMTSVDWTCSKSKLLTADTTKLIIKNLRNIIGTCEKINRYRYHDLYQQDYSIIISYRTWCNYYLEMNVLCFVSPYICMLVIFPMPRVTYTL